MSTATSKKVTSTALKGYLSTSKKPSRLVGHVEKHLLTRTLVNHRRQDVIHPSEMTKDDWCIREQYLTIQQAREDIAAGNRFIQERHPLRLQSIFDTGHAAHAKWQGYLAEMGKLYGKWACSGCENSVLGPVPEDSYVCESCGSRRFIYDEVLLKNEDLLIEGSTDGWVTGLGPDYLLEVKTVGTGTIRAYNPALLSESDYNLEKAFDLIRRPFKDHRRQGQMYLYLAHDMYDKKLVDREPPEEAVVLYDCKANQAYKEFVVKYSPSQIEPFLDLAQKVVNALEKSKAPKCNHGGCKKCEEKK